MMGGFVRDVERRLGATAVALACLTSPALLRAQVPPAPPPPRPPPPSPPPP
jgi:hypothetical protein